MKLINNNLKFNIIYLLNTYLIIICMLIKTNFCFGDFLKFNNKWGHVYDILSSTST